MPKPTPAEWLLARLTEPERAAAIYGDLTEMAATRGRLWFAAAYLHAGLAHLAHRPRARRCHHRTPDHRQLFPYLYRAHLRRLEHHQRPIPA